MNAKFLSPTKLIAAMGFAALMFAAGGANAALVNCPTSFTTDSTAKVTGGATTISAADMCQYVSPPDTSNVASTSNVNAAGFFGYTDWLDNGQTQTTPGSGQSGTWAIGSVDFTAYDYMIVFKDGAGTNLIGFLFNEEYSSGNWLTPFTDPPFTGANSKDVSHYSIFKRASDNPPGPPPMPEPASLALLGLGLTGIAVIRRRRQS